MSDDRMLEALAGLAREQQGDEPPAELLAPPADHVKARIVDDALLALGGAPLAAPTQARAPVAADPPGLLRRLRWLFAVGVPVAAAAAAVVLLAPGGDRAPALPRYAMEIRGGVAELRSGAGTPAEAPLVLAPGSSVELVLRPATAATGDVEARVFWVQGGQARRWNAQVQRSDEGAFLVRGPAERPFGPGPGADEGELVAVVARPGSLPDEAGVTGTPRPGWQVFRRAVSWR